jgi:hypothetical protein
MKEKKEEETKRTEDEEKVLSVSSLFCVCVFRKVSLGHTLTTSNWDCLRFSQTRS